MVAADEEAVQHSKDVAAVGRKYAAASLSTLKWMVEKSYEDGTPSRIVASVPPGLEQATSRNLFDTGNSQGGLFHVENGVAFAEGKAIDRLAEVGVKGDVFDAIRDKGSEVVRPGARPGYAGARGVRGA
jgi:hypothetical protein